jgi:uncharacterized protein involved in type VI secretion and phage assembly
MEDAARAAGALNTELSDAGEAGVRAAERTGERLDWALLGRAATLTIVTLDGATRLVHGVITRQEVAAHDASHEMRTLHLRLEPRMALLRHRLRSRVFHDMTAVAEPSRKEREARERAPAMGKGH